MVVKLSFHGADNGVTGSCHLVEYHGHRILIDCGLYQGSRELDEENARPFGFDPSAIDFVLLSLPALTAQSNAQRTRSEYSSHGNYRAA